jgi:hypothetical protein
MHKPNKKEAKILKVDKKKYFCGCKHKFGLNCQAVYDVRGIGFWTCPSLTKDPHWPALHSRISTYIRDLSNDCFKVGSGYVIFGDNAYLNSSYMATPYPNVVGKDGKLKKSKVNYNFYHLQLLI